MSRPANPIDSGRTKRLRDALTNSGLGVGEAAKAIGCHYVYLSKMIAGQRQGTTYLPRLAVLLKVPLPWLISGRGTAPSWATNATGSAASAYAEALGFLAAAERSVVITAKATGDDAAKAVDAISRARRAIERL